MKVYIITFRQGDVDYAGLGQYMFIGHSVPPNSVIQSFMDEMFANYIDPNILDFDSQGENLEAYIEEGRFFEITGIDITEIKQGEFIINDGLEIMEYTEDEGGIITDDTGNAKIFKSKI